MPAGISAALSMARPPVPAPTGEVALVTTQVEGGPSLWEADPEATSEALRLAGALLTRLLVDHRGYEVRSDGDGMLLAFENALTAARWCMDAQEALLRAEWPSGLLDCAAAAEVHDEDGQLVSRGLRIGMAIHHGTPESRMDARADRTTYVGPDVDWAVQVGRATHGGQILLTSEAWNSVEEVGSDLLDADVQDLGTHRFAGREEAATLFQILPWRLANRSFGDVRTGLNLRTNLPNNPGLFIGRERLLSAIERYFQKGRRIVVLKGQGGIGKTRLALRYAGIHVHEYCDAGGVWFCDLSEARSIDGICHAVARALGISLRARSMQATQQLGHALAARGRGLLVLDNFEQIERFAEYTLALWARKAPRMRMLVTSRHRLRVKGEAVVEMTPLDTSEAESLFRARVDELRPDVEIAEDDPHLAEIVDRLQCLPLAIELAAAWIQVLTLQGIAARLADGFAALEGVDVDVDPRHATLRQVMQSAWELLAPHEQEALVSCAAFRGGFTADAAQAVIDLGRYRNAPPPLKVLRTLRDKSLVHTGELPHAPGVVRWSLYDATREFATERLVAAGMRPTIERRHARFYLDYSGKQLKRMHTRSAPEALRALELELGNLRAVYTRYHERQPRLGMQAALALDPVLGARGPFDLHLDLLEGATQGAHRVQGSGQAAVRLAQVEALLQRGRYSDASTAIGELQELLDFDDEESLFYWVSAVSGWVKVQLGQTEDGTEALEAAHDKLSAMVDHPHAPVVAHRLALVRIQAGQLEAAQELLDASHKAAERRGDPWVRMEVLQALGDLARHRGDPTTGQRNYQQALEIAESLGDRPRQGRLWARLGSVNLDVRQGEEASRCLDAGRAHAEEVGDVVEVALIDGNIARMLHHQGHGLSAEETYRKALDAFHEAGATRWAGIFRGVLGALEHEQGRMDEARGDYERSVSTLTACGDRRFAGLVLARLGALHADEGRITEAQGTFRRAEEHLASVEDPLGMAALEVHRGHLDVAQARAGDAAGRKRGRARFKQATTPRREGDRLIQPAAAISNDVRLALRLLRRSMELGK